MESVEKDDETLRGSLDQTLISTMRQGTRRR